MSYFKKTIQGISWMTALRILIRSISFIKIAVLARLLNPMQFGLFGIASISLALLEILTDIGILPILIQEKKGIKKYLDAAWIVSILRGIAISFILLIIAKPVSIFFNSPKSYDLILLTSIVPLLKGTVNPALIIFQKELTFKKEFIFRSTINIIEAIVSISFIFLTGHVSGLIWGLIISTLIEVVLSWLFIKPRPRLKLEIHKIFEVIHRGKYITLSGVFNYLFHNVDDIFIGKLLGTTSLGLYQVAYKISTLPISEGGEIVSKVVFPVYTKIADNRTRLKKAFLRVLCVISSLILPFSVVLILFAEPFVMFILGSDWMEIVPVLRILVVFGAIRAISGSSSALFLAVKKQEYITVVTLVSFLSLLIVILPMVSQFGLIGGAYASLMGSIVAIPFMFYFTKKILYEKS